MKRTLVIRIFLTACKEKGDTGKGYQQVAGHMLLTMEGSEQLQVSVQAFEMAFN